VASIRCKFRQVRDSGGGAPVIPDFQTLMLSVLRSSATGGAKIGDVVDTLSREFGLSDEERSELLPSGRQTTIANRVPLGQELFAESLPRRSVSTNMGCNAVLATAEAGTGPQGNRVKYFRR